MSRASRRRRTDGSCTGGLGTGGSGLCRRLGQCREVLGLCLLLSLLSPFERTALTPGQGGVCSGIGGGGSAHAASSVGRLAGVVNVCRSHPGGEVGCRVLHVLQECVDALICSTEGITQGNSRGGAVVESKAHPVDRQVSAKVLGSGDNRTTQMRARCGGRGVDRTSAGLVINETA